MRALHHRRGEQRGGVVLAGPDLCELADAVLPLAGRLHRNVAIPRIHAGFLRHVPEVRVLQLLGRQVRLPVRPGREAAVLRLGASMEGLKNFVSLLS